MFKILLKMPFLVPPRRGGIVNGNVTYLSYFLVNRMWGQEAERTRWFFAHICKPSLRKLQIFFLVLLVYQLKSTFSYPVLKYIKLLSVSHLPQIKWMFLFTRSVCIFTPLTWCDLLFPDCNWRRKEVPEVTWASWPLSRIGVCHYICG